MNTLTMRAVAFDAPGPPEVLTLREMARPSVGDEEVLVRVHTTGVQPADVGVRTGWSPPGTVVEYPQIPGNEFAGVVAAVGSTVDTVAVGDEVLGFRVLGCYAEYVTAPATQVIAKPPTLEWDAAGALSASGQTADTALDDLALRPGETLLVQGAAGGVGSMAVQLARLRGVTVIGTAAPAHHDYLRELGVVPVAYGDGELDRLRAIGRIDAALDTAGHGGLRTALELVSDRDRVATIADVELSAELGCRFLRSRRSATRLATLADLAADGRLRVHVRRVLDLADAAAAHRDIETGHGRGKVVLRTGATR